MKLVLLVAIGLCQTVLGQFGGRGQCDYQRLSQAAVNKERCFQDIEELMREGMRAIQRIDPTCNEGMAEVCEKCQEPAKQMQSSNDVDAQGIMECCFQGRIGGGGFGGNGNRQCEFKDKKMDGHGKHGHGKHGHGGRGGRGGRRGPPGPPGMMEDEGDMMKQMITLGGMAMMSMGEMGEKMCKSLKWCRNEDRFINQRAIPVAKEYGDKLTAKLFECYKPMMDVATNCTDVQPEDLECLMNGYSWNMKMKKMCMMACSPNSLNSMCNYFLQSANMGGGNQQFNTNSRQENNQNNYYDPFSFSGRRK